MVIYAVVATPHRALASTIESGDSFDPLRKAESEDRGRRVPIWRPAIQAAEAWASVKSA